MKCNIWLMMIFFNLWMMYLIYKKIGVTFFLIFEQPGVKQESQIIATQIIFNVGRRRIWSPDNTKNCYVRLPNEYTSGYFQKLVQIGVIKHINLIDSIPKGKFETDHNFLKPARHIPPTKPTHDHNMSPVESCTFAQLWYIQNVQSLLYSLGANKYICKYIG